MKLSEKVELIIDIFDQCKSDTRWYTQQQTESEMEQLNLSHELEGVGTENRSPPKGTNRNKLATLLQGALIKRRIAKDMVIVNQPLIKFLESESGIRSYNLLKQVLGELRKTETNMAERRYTKRELAIDKKINNPTMKESLNKMIRDWKRKQRSKH